MMIRRFAVAWAFLALAGSAAADTYYLRGNDPAGQSSFVTNFTSGGTSIGWSSGAAPDAAHDYYVDVSKRTLLTPAASTGSTRYTFPGKSLELKNGGLLKTVTWYAQAQSSGPSVDLGSKFILTSGEVGVLNCWTGKDNNADFYGTVEIGATSSANATFSTPLKNGTWGYHFTVTGASGKAFRITNRCGLNEYYSSASSLKDCSYIRRKEWNLLSVLDGDLSGYLGTTELSCMTDCRLDSATTFGGSFSLLHHAKLSVIGTQSAQTISGSITAKDGWVNVGASHSLTVGSYTSAFSPVSELKRKNTSSGSGGWTNPHKGQYENVYTAELWDENGQNYVPTHKMSWSSTVRVNTLTVGANGSFAATTANLGRTLLEVASGANVTFGSLTASNVYLQVKGGLVTVTDSLTLKAPFVVQSTGSSLPKPVLRVKDGAGTITESDFVFDGYQNVKGQCRYRCSVEHEDGYQVLYVEDLMPGTYNASSGYVTMATGHAEESSHATYLKERAMSSNTLYWTELNGLKAAWSDGQNPHATTNYYQDTWLGSVNETFAGRSLTVAGNCKIRIYPQGLSPTISDYRLLPSAILPYDINGTDDYTLGGTATLLSTHAKPNTLRGGYNTATMDMNLVGDENASLLVYGDRDTKLFISIFKGDLSAYYGEMVLTNRTKTIFRTSATNATIALVHTNATLTVDSSAAGTVALGTLRSQGGTIDIAQGKTLAAGTLAVTGTVSKTGAGLFRAGGTATAGTDAVLAVSNGFVQATSADAFKGVGLYFAAGTGFVVDIAEGAPLKATEAVTAKDKIAVRLDGVSRTATYDEPIVIAKLPTASAADFAAKLKVSRPRGYAVSEPAVGATADAEGLVPITVTLTRVGTAIFLR